MLYFYPAAFTPGCTIEAHDFAEATDKFKALGATVIGVSYDNIDTLNKFSVSECRSKFGVASDADQKIMKAYDAVLKGKPELGRPHLVRDRPDGRDPLHLYEPQTGRPRRQHHGRRSRNG